MDGHAGLVEPVEKFFEILTVNSPKNKESKKSNDAQYRARMRENRSKQGNTFIKQENDSK